MRLIDADKLHPDRMTNKGNVAISQSQIAKAPTVNAVSEEVYTREYNLRKDAEFKVYKLEKALEQKQNPKTIQEIQAESEKYQKAFEDGYGQGYAQARFDYEQEPCEDAISRKEVLNQIFYSTDNGGDVVLGSVLRHRIENLPSVKPQEPKWIPCSERLPKERDWYLAVFKEKDTDYQLIPRVSEYIGENNWRIIDEEAFVKNYRDILECVAWMPLPEPYKPESEDEK